MNGPPVKRPAGVYRVDPVAPRSGPAYRGDMSADAVWALEVVPHDQDVDPHARALRQILRDLGAHPVGVTHGRLYLIAGPQSTRLHAAVRDLCVDPVIAKSRVVAFPSADDGWLIEILPHPG